MSSRDFVCFAISCCCVKAVLPKTAGLGTHHIKRTLTKHDTICLETMTFTKVITQLYVGNVLGEQLVGTS
jgi:hypothetical protein